MSIEQEPVAWMYKQMDCYGEWGTIFKVDKPYISYHDIKDIVPVYTAPPKLERINHDDILDRSIDGSFEYRDGFMDGVMFAENHHGIGGGNE
jgi:hypothetical protein